MTKNKTDETVHKINNLLTSVTMAAEMLSRELVGKLNAEQKKYVDIILSEAKNIKTTIKKLSA